MRLLIMQFAALIKFLEDDLYREGKLFYIEKKILFPKTGMNFIREKFNDY